MPLVSIVTPTYNSARFIRETINSVKAQTISDWEYIIVDDCSNDNTREIIEDEAQNDPRIKLIKLNENRGPGNARNIAFDHSKSRFIAFLDSDDIWLPSKLEKQLEFMFNNNATFSYTLYRRMSRDGSVIGRLIFLPPSLTYHGMLKNTGIAGCSTVVLDRQKTGPIHMPDLLLHQDLVLWLSLLKRGITAYCVEIDLVRYRIVKNSISSNKLNSSIKLWAVYRRIEHLNIFYAAWCFLNYSLKALIKLTTLK